MSLGIKRRGPTDLFRRYNRQDLENNGIRGVELNEKEREESR